MCVCSKDPSGFKVEEGGDDGGSGLRKAVGREVERAEGGGVPVPLCILGASPEKHAAKAATLLLPLDRRFLKNTKYEPFKQYTREHAG